LFYENHSLFFINSNFYIFSCSSDAGIEEQRFINNDIYFPPLNSGIWKKILLWFKMVWKSITTITRFYKKIPKSLSYCI